jgi:hypothetical protein
MRSGALLFEPVSTTSGTSGISRAMYGNQGVDVRIYNTPVAIDSTTTPGTKTWTGNVGILNLLTHSIGDEQATAAPPDTMGIFVFFTATPTVTAPVPCAGCTVTINTFDGTGSFTTAGQQYFWWNERLAGGDTTRTRKLWSFSAPSQVTAFSFTVLVGASWPPPDESRWKVTLNGDSLPTTQEEPRWRLEQVGGGSFTATGGLLTVTAASNGTRRFFRRDSVASTGSAYIEARVQIGSGNPNRPESRMVIDDGVRFVAIGVARNNVWFTDANGSYLTGTPFPIAADGGQNIYQLRKYGADSAVFFVNGTRRGARAYTAFPVTAYPGVAPLFQFGNESLAGAASGVWDYVVYESGVPLP